MATREQRKKYKRQIRVKNTLLVLLMLTMVATIALFAINILNINKKNVTEEPVVSEPVVDKKYTNDLYTIGNNPTDINKEYFLALNESVASGDTTQMAVDVVKCFVTEYYTWTNKDGNYDIGGIQYIDSDRRSDFETYTRYNFYSDMDLYLTQYGSSSLMEVASVDASGNPVEDITVLDRDGNSVTYPCVSVYATWTYGTNSTMDLSSAQTSGTFLVMNHDGRMEIASIQQ